jgi:hypothetical protein
MEGFGKLQKMGCGCSVPHMKDGGYVSKARAEEDQGFKATKKAVGGAISIIDAVGKPVGGSVAPGKPSAKDRRAAMKLKPKVSVEIPLGMKKGGKMADGGIVPIVKVKKVEPVKAKPADDSTPSPKVQEEMRKARDEARELKLMEDAYNKAGGELKFAKGGAVKESAKEEKAETKKIAAIGKELKSHEKLPASKGHKGLKCGGKVKKMAEGGIVPGSDYWANRAATRALPPSASAPAMESSPSTQMAYHSAAVPSAGTLTPQEEVARRIGLRANPAAGNPQAYDPSGQAVYVGGSKAAQTQALQQAQAALPTTSKLYKAAPAVTPPSTGSGQGAGTGSGGAYTFEDQARDRYGINPAPSTGNGQGVGSVTSPPIQSGGLPFQNMGGLPFQNMGGNPFQNMGGNPLGFLNQNNLGGQNKYLPQLARVIGNRLGYPQQGGGTKFERPSQQNELQQTGRFAGMPKVLTGGSNIPGRAGTTEMKYLDPETGSYGAYPGSRQFLTGERDDDPGTAPGWVRPQQNGGVDYRSLFGGGALPNLKDVISKFGPSAPSMSDAEFQRQMAEERKAIAERQARGDYSDNIYHTM